MKKNKFRSLELKKIKIAQVDKKTATVINGGFFFSLSGCFDKTTSGTSAPETFGCRPSDACEPSNVCDPFTNPNDELTF